MLAYGKTTQLKVEGDWADPGFDGGFLPASRICRQTGFDAEWSVPFIARGLRAEGPARPGTGSMRRHWGFRSSKSPIRISR